MKIAASAQFPEILVSDITKTAAKRFRKLALGDATEVPKTDGDRVSLRLIMDP